MNTKARPDKRRKEKRRKEKREEKKEKNWKKGERGCKTPNKTIDQGYQIKSRELFRTTG